MKAPCSGSWYQPPVSAAHTPCPTSRAAGDTMAAPRRRHRRPSAARRRRRHAGRPRILPWCPATPSIPPAPPRAPPPPPGGRRHGPPPAGHRARPAPPLAGAAAPAGSAPDCRGSCRSARRPRGEAGPGRAAAEGGGSGAGASVTAASRPGHREVRSQVQKERDTGAAPAAASWAARLAGHSPTAGFSLILPGTSRVSDLRALPNCMVSPVLRWLQMCFGRDVGKFLKKTFGLF